MTPTDDIPTCPGDHRYPDGTPVGPRCALCITGPTDDIPTLLARALLDRSDHDFHNENCFNEGCSQALEAQSMAEMALATPSGKAILDRLARAEAVVDSAASMGLCSQTHHEHLMRDALAAKGGRG